MSMTPRTVVKKTLEFDRPDRIAYNFRAEGYPDDTVWGGIAQRTDFDYGWHEPSEYASRYPMLKTFRGLVRHDEQGSLWGKLPGDYSNSGEVLQGVFQDWSQLDGYTFPHLSDPKRMAHIEEDYAKQPDKFRFGGLPGFPFAIMRYMRKMEIFLEDLLLEPERVMQLNEMVTRELEGVIDNFAALGADGIFTCEDWGTQDRLLINPTLWREMFKPTLKRIFDRIHSKNMYVLMHSCGYIWEILPDLMEIGVDAMQFDQPTLMGIERLADLFDHRVTLFSSVDIQKILPTGDKALIEKSARQMVDLFASKGGGLIAKDYGDYKTIQIDDEWAKWMRDEFMRYGGDLSRYTK